MLIIKNFKNLLLAFWLSYYWCLIPILADADNETTQIDLIDSTLANQTDTQFPLTVYDNYTNQEKTTSYGTLNGITTNVYNNQTEEDYYYYVNVYEDVPENETTNGSKLHFTGDDQPRPGLGINVGWITPEMDQWVFANKFKHAR